jgi:hypothetical protein
MMGWEPSRVRIILQIEQLYGYRFDRDSRYEVWWLDRMWPCRTREDVKNMEDMKREAKFRGADLHRWWT